MEHLAFIFTLLFLDRRFPQKWIDWGVLSLVHFSTLTMHDFIFLMEYIKDAVYIPPFLSTLPEDKSCYGRRPSAVITSV